MLVVRADVQGRITERQLPLAERSMPGISRFYASLDEKPATFLQPLWAYEGQRSRRNVPRNSTRSNPLRQPVTDPANRCTNSSTASLPSG